MAAVEHSEASLRFWGDDLDPDEISQILGVRPTAAGTKGSVRKTLRSGKQVIAKSGYWHHEAKSESPADLDKQLFELIGAFKADKRTLRGLVKRYHGNLFTGLFLKLSNGGIHISAKTLTVLGSLGFSLDVDIYSDLDEPEALHKD
jgi:Domain of unknown function (DUF4279)